MQQRDQRHCAEGRDDGVAHAVAADADQPQGARGPSSGHHARPRPEAPTEPTDRQHAGHAEGRGRGSERQRGLAKEVERPGDHVCEECLAAAVALEPDHPVGVEPGLVENLEGVDSLGRLVAVEAAGVGGEVVEAEEHGCGYDGGLYGDEAAEGIDALKILHQPGFHPDWMVWFQGDGGREALFAYAVSYTHLTL